MTNAYGEIMSWGVESLSRKTHDKFVDNLPPNDMQQQLSQNLLFYTGFFPN